MVNSLPTNKAAGNICPGLGMSCTISTPALWLTSVFVNEPKAGLVIVDHL